MRAIFLSVLTLISVQCSLPEAARLLHEDASSEQAVVASDAANASELKSPAPKAELLIHKANDSNVNANMPLMSVNSLLGQNGAGQLNPVAQLQPVMSVNSLIGQNGAGQSNSLVQLPTILTKPAEIPGQNAVEGQLNSLLGQNPTKDAVSASKTKADMLNALLASVNESMAKAQKSLPNYNFQGYNSNPWVLPPTNYGGFGNLNNMIYGQGSNQHQQQQQQQQNQGQQQQQHQQQPSTVADIIDTLKASNANLTQAVSELANANIDINKIVQPIVQGRPSFDDFMKALASSNLDINKFLKMVVDQNIDVNKLVKQLAYNNVSVDQLFRNLANGGVDFNSVLKALANSKLDIDAGLDKLRSTGIDAALVLNSPALPGMVNAGVLTNPQLGDLLASIPSK